MQARRRAIAMLGNRNIVSEEDGNIVKKGTVIGKLFSELGQRYLDRKGGYTRIIHLSLRRLGDNGQLVLLQLVGAEQKAKEEKKTKKAKREIAEQAEQNSETAVEAQSSSSGTDKK